MARPSKVVDLVYRVATGSRKLRNFFTPVGAAFYGLIICVFVLAGLKVDRLLGIGRTVPPIAGIILSIPVFLPALFLVGWSVKHFIAAKGTPVPVNPPRRLVATGPYAHTRNPMLTGIFGLLFGFGLLLGSSSLLFVFTPIFILLNVLELKFIEEPELKKRLGEPYVVYRTTTPMFFPLLSRRKNKTK